MEASSPSALLKLLAPKLPMIFKTALSHTVGWSSTSSKWDLRTEVTIHIIRSLINNTSNPSPISRQQRLSLRDPGVKGQMWISRITLPAPAEDDARQLLFKAIDELKESDEAYTKPDLRPVEAEWTGFRQDATKHDSEPAISEAEKYENLMKEVKSDVVVLYFHGGAYYLMDPASHRPVTSRLAHMTQGRVLSVRYRLAPQNPFPAALLDGLVAYLSLLYPPPDSPHAPISASNIIFAGDSAGGNLCFSLLHLLLHLHRTSPTNSPPNLTWHGQTVSLPLPAGLATASPWLDVTRSLPSLESNACYDYLPPPSASHLSRFPPCPIWPTDPPRADIYADGSALCHPLVSPLAADAASWAGAPPMLVLCGEEMLADECAVVAQRAASQGVKVVWEEYEAMPHCFAMMLEHTGQSKMCFESWARFCRDVVEKGDEGVEAKGVFVRATRGCERESVDLGQLSSLSDGEVGRSMREAKERLEKRVDQAGKAQAQPRL